MEIQKPTTSTENMTDSLNKRFCTDAEKTVVGNTSGTNSGDQNIFSTIAVNGQSNIVADTTSDTFTLIAGTNITLTTNSSTDSVTIDASGGGTKANKTEAAAGTDDTKFLTALSTAGLFSISEGTVLNGKISVTVASNNLTVALKGKDGNNPSATNPVYAMIGGTLRTISSALSVTKNAGTNWCNSGRTELADIEVDYFVYLGYNTTDGVTIGFSRICAADNYSDFSTTTTNDRYCAISTITNATSTDYYNIIGRFAATLSGGAGYTWSVPTFTAKNLIQRPIYTTRSLTYNPTIIWTGTAPTSENNSYKFIRYNITNNIVEIRMCRSYNNTGSNNTSCLITTPFYMLNVNGAFQSAACSITPSTNSVSFMNGADTNRISITTSSVSAYQINVFCSYLYI